MQKNTYLLILFLIVANESLVSQINVDDSLKKVWQSDDDKSRKADQLSKLIFQYAPVEPETVLPYTDSLIDTARSMGDSILLSRAFNRKGVVYYYLGDYNSALDNYFVAIGIKERIQQGEIWRDYNNIALVLRNLEQNQEALKYFTEALHAIQEQGNDTLKALILNNIGMTNRGLRNFESAEKALNDALKISTNLGLAQSRAFNLNNLGNVYSDIGRFTDAEQCFLEALEINQSLFNRYEEAQIGNNLITLYVKMEKLNEAAFYIEKNEELIDELGTWQLKLTFLGFKSTFFEKLGDLKLALQSQKEYNILQDSIFFASRTKQFNQLKNLANTEKELQRLEFLEKINIIQGEKLKFQRALQTLGVSVIILVLVLLFLALRNLKMVKGFNSTLSDRNNHIEMLNDELKSYNEELIAQKENLNQTLIELKQAQNQLFQSEKMASLGVLAAGIAHEINNPLNFIMGGYNGLNEHMVECGCRKDADVMLLLNSIGTGVTRASNIVKALGQFSRGNEDFDESCDVHQIIENCIVMLHNQLKNKVIIQRNFYTQHLIIKGNVGKLHQVFVNIISNALHAVHENGIISIDTSQIGSMVEIVFTDNGEGISEDDMPYIMDPFFTTKEPGKGTGLGLSISYAIIREHQGDIEVTSTKLQGTKVKITIPINRSGD